MTRDYLLTATTALAFINSATHAITERPDWLGAVFAICLLGSGYMATRIVWRHA